MFTNRASPFIELVHLLNPVTLYEEIVQSTDLIGTQGKLNQFWSQLTLDQQSLLGLHLLSKASSSPQPSEENSNDYTR